MRNSSIFEEYTKIAVDKGLLSNSKELKKTAAEEKKKDLSSIEILYGLKPNGKEDEKTIIEKAHPTTFVAAPSYDKLNGIVENEEQRHNMIMEILNLPRHGNYELHRHAEQELVNELIRLSFKLGNEDEIELMQLAGTCVESIHKKAVAQFALPAIGILGAGLGLYSVYKNFASFASTVPESCASTLEQIPKFIELAPLTSEKMTELKQGVEYIKSLYASAIKKAEELRTRKAGVLNVEQGAGTQELQLYKKDMTNFATNLIKSVEGQEGYKVLESFKKAATLLSERINTIYLPLVKTTEVSGDSDWKHLWGLAGNSQKDLINSLQSLAKSLTESVTKITEKQAAIKAYVEQHEKTLTEQLQQAEKPAEKPVVKEQPKSKTEVTL